MTSSPWDHIERAHQGLPRGSLLDAGTGLRSSRWAADFAERCWTGVTASAERAVEVVTADKGRLVVGCWSDSNLLRGEVYDVVLAHYLLGALERFSPYFEGHLFARLRPLVGGRLYVVGLQPVLQPATEEESAVSELMSFRDACYLLNGGRAYREYPLDWTLSSLAQSGFRVLETRQFPNLYGRPYIDNLTESCQAEISLLDETVAAGLRCRLAALRSKCLDLLAVGGTLWWSFDYLVVCEVAT